MFSCRKRTTLKSYRILNEVGQYYYVFFSISRFMIRYFFFVATVAAVCFVPLHVFLFLLFNRFLLVFVHVLDRFLTLKNYSKIHKCQNYIWDVTSTNHLYASSVSDSDTTYYYGVIFSYWRMSWECKIANTREWERERNCSMCVCGLDGDYMSVFQICI